MEEKQFYPENISVIMNLMVGSNSQAQVPQYELSYRIGIVAGAMESNCLSNLSIAIHTNNKKCSTVTYLKATDEQWTYFLNFYEMNQLCLKHC